MMITNINIIIARIAELSLLFLLRMIIIIVQYYNDNDHTRRSCDMKRQSRGFYSKT